jgi:L-serine deaminase
VTLAFGDDDRVPADLERALFANSKSMSRAERLRVLRRALNLVTHPAQRRDQVAAAIDWSRIDAAQMITMTAGGGTVRTASTGGTLSA